MSANTMSFNASNSTLGDFLDIIVPTYVQAVKSTLKECESYTQNIKLNTSITLDSEDNIFRKEQEYHCDGNHDLERGIDQVLEVFEFNNYVPGYKLLTKRTQCYLFSKCMLAHFPALDDNGNIPAPDINSESREPTEMEKAVDQLCNTGLVEWLRYCVLSHPDVEEVLKPVADRYEEVMRKEIKRLDDIPHVEQKTDEWHAIRKNMVSASVAGYMDSEACGCNISHEKSKMEEKCGIKDRKPFSWGCVPLRHGQQYEDVSGHMYDTFNRLDSKEYGILPDHRYSWIGASPDGVIMRVKEPSTTITPKHSYNTRSTDRKDTQIIYPNTTTASNDAKGYLDRALIGRMREIKNPVSRNINDKIPPYYYWQMLQQMYVCQLPMCDFIQTLIKYPQECEWSIFIADSMPYDILTSATSWLEYQKILSPYILENVDWPIMNLFLTKKHKLDHIYNIPLTYADNMLSTTLASRFKEITHIAPENVNRRGQVKGILWCFTREDANGEVDFRVEFTSINEAVTDSETIFQQECALKDKHERDGGFKLSEKHYWNVEEYNVIEVEYNQGLYEGLAKFCQRPGVTENEWHKDNCIISRLRYKWDIVEELRAINDLKAKKAKYDEYYPPSKLNRNKAASGNKTAFGNPKYQRRKKSGGQPRIRSAFNLD